MNGKKPLFESNASETLQRVQSVFCERGTQYGDTWRNCQWLTMKAVAREFRLNIPDRYFRALAAACLVDVKYQRSEGGYKEDNLVDGIAYQANLVSEVRALKAAQN